MKTFLNVAGMICLAITVLASFLAVTSSVEFPWRFVPALLSGGILAFFGAAVLDRLDLIAERLLPKSPAEQSQPAPSPHPVSLSQADTDTAVRDMQAALRRT